MYKWEKKQGKNVKKMDLEINRGTHKLSRKPWFQKKRIKRPVKRKKRKTHFQTVKITVKNKKGSPVIKKGARGKYFFQQ